jgi:propionyl-CoA carboxylase alpha chain
MALATTLIYHLRESLVQQSLLPLKSTVGVSSPEKTSFSYVAKSESDIFSILLENRAGTPQWRIEIEGTAYTVLTPPLEYYRRRLKLTINDESSYFRLKYNGNFIEAAHNGVCRNFEIYNPREWEVARFMPPPATRKRDDILDCPMPGLVVDVRVKAGERVYRGQEMIILESMKMESAVSAPHDGVIETVNVQPGDAVETGSALIHFRKS